jgi:MYXO-CTERM domain-containing protein
MNKRQSLLGLLSFTVSTIALASAMLVLFSGTVSAAAIFNATGSGGDGSLDATVTFSNFSTANGGTLDITLQNNIADPGAAGQLISDLTFNLSNGGIALTFPGTLSNTISNGSGGPVTVVDFQNGNTTTTTKPASWQFSYTDGAFFLNDLTGGQPKDMIIGAGPYNPLPNRSVTGPHNPSLGTTMFVVTGLTGLLPTTTVSNVVVSFGTGPDSFSSTITCTGTNSSCGGHIESTPEPASLALAGLGLLGLGLFGRRLRRRF